MIYKLAQAAEKTWNRLRGHNQLPKVIIGVKFNEESRSSNRKLKPLPPDLGHHQDSAITPGQPRVGDWGRCRDAGCAMPTSG